MPKLGMQPIRRAALVKATIAEIGAQGSLDVTVIRIARRAGMSSALAHHYFGSKDQIFLAAMRHVMAVSGAEVRGALAMAVTPHDRLVAVIRAAFGSSNFRPEVIAAWLNFFVLARTSTEAGRLLRLYQRRLESNLRHDLRPLAGPAAPAIAERLGGLIDGLCLRQGLRAGPPDGAAVAAHVIAALDLELRAVVR